MSANEVLEALLDAMPDSYQKTIGFPTYDLLAAASLLPRAPACSQASFRSWF